MDLHNVRVVSNCTTDSHNLDGNSIVTSRSSDFFVSDLGASHTEQLAVYTYLNGAEQTLQLYCAIR